MLKKLQQNEITTSCISNKRRSVDKWRLHITIGMVEIVEVKVEGLYTWHDWHRRRGQTELDYKWDENRKEMGWHLGSLVGIDGATDVNNTSWIVRKHIFIFTFTTFRARLLAFAHLQLFAQGLQVRMANYTCFYNDNNIHQYQVTDESGLTYNIRKKIICWAFFRWRWSTNHLLSLFYQPPCPDQGSSGHGSWIGTGTCTFSLKIIGCVFLRIGIGRGRGNGSANRYFFLRRRRSAATFLAIKIFLWWASVSRGAKSTIQRAMANIHRSIVADLILGLECKRKYPGNV